MLALPSTQTVCCRFLWMRVCAASASGRTATCIGCLSSAKPADMPAWFNSVAAMTHQRRLCSTGTCCSQLTHTTAKLGLYYQRCCWPRQAGAGQALGQCIALRRLPGYGGMYRDCTASFSGADNSRSYIGHSARWLILPACLAAWPLGRAPPLLIYGEHGVRFRYQLG